MRSTWSPDAASPDVLARAHLGLAFHVARDYLARARAIGIPREDLLQEAVIGLLQATRGFDPSVGTRFGVFASVAIRNHLLNVLAERRRRAFRGLPAARMAPIADQADPRGQPSHCAAALAEDLERARGLLRLLTDRERVIVRLYFWDDLSFASIGALIGLSGERVRQIFNRSLPRLRGGSRSGPRP